VPLSPHIHIKDAGFSPWGPLPGETRVEANCHPEEAESHAKRATPDEGPMHLLRKYLRRRKPARTPSPATW
jgi:hypothetical protein